MHTAPLIPARILSANQQISNEVWMWLGIIVGLAVLFAIVAMALRKKLQGREEPPPVGFTLADLRRMHAEGQLSDEELAQAEAKTVTRSRSHYLGDETDETGESDASAHDSSTSDPPPGGPGAENPQDPPDKNAGGGPAG